MPKDTVNDLIQELQKLQLRQTAIIQELNQALQKNKDPLNKNTSTDCTPSVPTTIDDIILENRSQENNTPKETYEPGDRIYIKNRVTSITRRANARDKTATVLYTTQKNRNKPRKIHFRTGNDLNTWRLEHNVQKITSKDKNRK